jgi:hypothetical protein
LTLWSPRYDNYFRAALIAAPFFEDFTADVAEGAQTLVIPKLGDVFPATAITTTTGAMIDTTIADTVVRLDINKWYGNARIISDFQMTQVSNKYRLMDIYAQNQSEPLARKMDTDILALGASLTPAVGGSTVIYATTLEAAMRVADSYNLPHEDLLFIFHPTAYWKGIGRVDKFIQAAQYGVPVLPNGTLRQLYGIPIVLTTQIPKALSASVAYRNLLVHRKAFCYAIGNLPGGTTNGVTLKVKDSEDLHIRIIAEIVYGIVLRSATAGVKIYSGV